ncbi:MAG: hypothetical protein V3R45_05805 [Candidatus Aminicenantaceae bacterium]
MREVILQIPTLEAEQNIDIDVRINGKKRTMHYRVEIIDWELIQIGAPIRNNIPITFRKKEESDQ